jgi:hypothetical protein
MAKKLWGIKVIHGGEDNGWLIDHGRVVCVYDDKDFAEKDAKWLNDFKKKCGSKGSYEVKKWVPEEGVEVALQIPSSSKQSSSMPKMNERRSPAPKPSTPEPSDAAPRPTINTNLSELFVASLADDATA